MTSQSKSKLCAALLATALIGSACLTGTVQAGGPAQGPGVAAQSANLVHDVKYRGQRHRRSGNSHIRGHNRGRNSAIGIGALIIGGLVLSEAARSEHRRQHYSDWQRCASTYRSFERDTGMYTGYDGERHACPYLR